MNRWNITYNIIIDVKSIQNKELLFYYLSNRILNNFKYSDLNVKKSILQSLKHFKIYINLIKDREEE